LTHGTDWLAILKNDGAHVGAQDMTAPPEEQPGFAPDDDAPIRYMARTREYYQAIGYTTPYRWAHYVDAPFHPLRKPLSQSRVTIVTTAAPFDPAKGDQGPGNKYNGGAKFYQVYDGDTSKTHDLRISHIAYDRVHTSADDSGTWFPLPLLRRLASERRIGEIAPRFFGAPTNRSHRITLETDAPEILARCRADNVDAAVLVPNCPVCHQTISLVARHLEANGIATVVMGCAKDIVEHAAVPRFLFSDFPLANSAGRPHDPNSQAFTLELALRVLETAPAAQTTVQSPLRWGTDASWKRDYNNVALLSADELARRRREFDAQKEIARELRESAA
jgi:D-proline reductase (dithiol) PrdB